MFEFLAGERYYKLSPKSILELDGEIRCYYEGNSLDPNCAACKSLGRFSYCNLKLAFYWLPKPMLTFDKPKKIMKTVPSN